MWRPLPDLSWSVRYVDPRTTITRVTKMAIAEPMPRAIAVRRRRRESQMVRAISAAVTSGRIQVSRSNHLTAAWAGPRALDCSRVICAKSDGNGLPDQFATCWMPASGLMSGVMTGGLNRAESPPGSLPSAHTRTWLTSGQEVEVHVAALDVHAVGLAAQQGDDLLVPDAVDLEPQVVGLGRAQHLGGALLDEVLDDAGDRSGEELRLRRERVSDALLQVGRRDRLAGDVVAQALDGLGILADRADEVHVAVGVHDGVVHPDRHAAHDHGEAAEEHEEAHQQAPRAAGPARRRWRRPSPRRPCLRRRPASPPRRRSP